VCQPRRPRQPCLELAKSYSQDSEHRIRRATGSAITDPKPYRDGYFVANFSRFDTAEKKTKLGQAKGVIQLHAGNEDTQVASKLSARNKIEGKIVELEVDGVMAHVAVRVGKNTIESVITKRSAEEMNLKVGDTVSAVIKSTEVMLQKG
jgi:molybdopterin-binding protein